MKQFNLKPNFNGSDIIFKTQFHWQSMLLINFIILILINKNKRPMDHIAHLRNQFKLIKYILAKLWLYYKKKHPIISFLRIEWSLFIKLWVPYPFTHGSFVSSLVKLAQWFWRRRFLNFVNVFLLYHNYLPLEKGVALPLNKYESPSTKATLYQLSLVETGPLVLEKIFKFCQCSFAISLWSPLQKGCSPSFVQTWTPSPKDALKQVLLK